MKKLAPPLATLLLTIGCSHSPVPLPQAPSAAASAATAARGEYIVRTLSVCGDCHSGEEKNPDGPLSGGREFRDWRIGVARASNLTPDPETGLGNWSEAQIVRALRNGQDDEGRLLAPVMPYEWYHAMSDEDAFAVARYLKSLPPVRNKAESSPNLAFKLGKLFLRPKPAMTTSAPPRAATAEYGAYLSQHVALCADCHTQRTGLLQKPDRGRLFAGMTKPPKGFPAKPPNITPDPVAGIGRWTEADFTRAMRTGLTPEGEKLHPLMPWPQFQRMTEEDLHALWLYLRTVAPAR